ncbi:hypothetical protein HWV62_20756 [Athelia sp. TMB]|nr:hypothetical protein HWV62_20756 [Athelia sp. TMB]
MSFAVKYQMKLHGAALKAGDVLMTNSPWAGGSHLPDITIITPVFAPGAAREIIFFVASRGHHADIGGILPGSMPPTSVALYEEGAEIESFKIVNNGIFDHDGLMEHMCVRPARWDGCSGCRNVRDVESDLKAVSAGHLHTSRANPPSSKSPRTTREFSLYMQVSDRSDLQTRDNANICASVVQDYTLPTVQSYMYHIRSNAEAAVRTLLRKVSKDVGPVLEAVDWLDDGSPIALKVVIDAHAGSATLDFTGTGPEVRGNLNAPISVVHSAVIYCMRSMLEDDIPLNAGCLVPLSIVIPPKSLLSPSRTAAVCGGNVLTSQRIVDVVLRAFGACAASQGCTNNLTFGAGGKDKDGKNEAGWGYYETIAGGSGAGPGWHGTSGVHTHITNTRIGDVELLERRYPVLIHRFGLRHDSAGKGRWRGGEGCVREFEVLQGLQVSMLSERRTRQPYGMQGGGPGALGRNTWIKQPREEDGDMPAEDEDGVRMINIGGKATLWMGKGDRLLIETPGGGAWGAEEEGDEEDAEVGEWGRQVGAGVWEARGSLAERAAAQASF